MLHPGAVDYGHNNAELEVVIQYIQSKSVPIVTISEAMQYYMPNLDDIPVTDLE